MTNPQTCLLIRTVDNRHFFTQTENFPQLIEFSKTVGAEVSVVRPEQSVQVLEIQALVRSFCNLGLGSGDVKYVVLEQKIAANPSVKPFVVKKSPPKREAVLALAQEVRGFIKERLLAGDVLSVQDLLARFGEKLTLSSLRSHLSNVREKLGTEGYTVDKIAQGSYQVS